MKFNVQTLGRKMKGTTFGVEGFTSVPKIIPHTWLPLQVLICILRPLTCTGAIRNTLVKETTTNETTLKTYDDLSLLSFNVPLKLL